MSEAPLWIGSEGSAQRALARALRAERVVALPEALDELARWRDAEAARERCARIVVAAWSARAVAGEIARCAPDAWLARAEQPIARWTFALGAAAARCADGGAIVAVVERPAPLDCAGFAPEAAVADAACALVRSLARSEGARGVRVNAVATSARLAAEKPVAPPPALASFPGALDREVAGAVRLLLSDDAAGVTGQVVAADCGRTW